MKSFSREKVNVKYGRVQAVCAGVHGRGFSCGVQLSAVADGCGGCHAGGAAAPV